MPLSNRIDTQKGEGNGLPRHKFGPPSTLPEYPQDGSAKGCSVKTAEENDGFGIQQTFKQSTRRVRTIGDTGDGIVTYADYRSHHDAQKLPSGTAADTTTGSKFRTTEL